MRKTGTPLGRRADARWGGNPVSQEQMSLLPARALERKGHTSEAPALGLRQPCCRFEVGAATARFAHSPKHALLAARDGSREAACRVHEASRGAQQDCGTKSASRLPQSKASRPSRAAHNRSERSLDMLPARPISALAKHAVGMKLQIKIAASRRKSFAP